MSTSVSIWVHGWSLISSAPTAASLSRMLVWDRVDAMTALDAIAADSPAAAAKEADVGRLRAL